jgi:hypothetical protein
VQILATFNTLAGLTSTTVTSVNDTATATPIVEALNQIASCATVALSAFDRQFHRYPSDHLDALADPSARPALVQGAHSLWYEHVKILLRQALQDLDKATADLPTPIRTAITAELNTEAQHLRAGQAEDETDDDQQRLWDSRFPVTLFGGGMEPLTDSYRERLNEADKEYTASQMRRAVDSLRVLAEAHRQVDSDSCQLETEYLSITEDPFNEERYFVEVSAPDPAENPETWTVSLQQWIPDNDDFDENGGTATGEQILDCNLAQPPTAGEIAAFLKQCAEQPDLFTTWAKTSIGEPLTGTPFIVSERH